MSLGASDPDTTFYSGEIERRLLDLKAVRR